MRRQVRHSALIRGHPLKQYRARRFRTQPIPSDPLTVERMAAESYRDARPVSAEEAAALLNRRCMGAFRGCFYRYDGQGIWAAAWDGGKEDVRTYLTPRPRRWPTPCRIPLARRRACA